MLNGLKGKYNITVNKVDITADDELYELYRFDIPVLEFRNGAALHGRIRKKDIVKILEKMR